MMDNVNVLRQIIANQTIEIHQLKKRIDVITNSDWGDGYTYESPDGGETVYRRRIGSPVQSRVQVNVEDIPTYSVSNNTWTRTDTSTAFDSNGMDNEVNKPPF